MRTYKITGPARLFWTGLDSDRYRGQTVTARDIGQGCVSTHVFCRLQDGSPLWVPAEHLSPA